MADFNIAINLRTNVGGTGNIRALTQDVRGLGNAFGQVNRGSSGRGLQNIGRNLQGAGAAITRASNVAEGFLRPAINEAKEFNRSLSEVKAFGGKQFIDNIDEITEKARFLGKTTEFTANDAAASFRVLAQAGRTPAQALDEVDASLNLAKAGATSLERATGIVASTMAQFQKEGTSAAEATDLIAKASNTTQSNAAQLGQALSFVGGTAGTMNISLQDTLVLLAGLGKTAINSGRAGRNLNAFISKLSQMNRPQARKIFKGLGIDAKALRSELDKGDILSAVTRLRKGFIDSGASVTQMNDALVRLFGEQGARAVKALFTAIDSGDFSKIQGDLQNANGAAAEMATLMTDNLAGDVKKAESAISDLKIEIGTKLIPALRPMIGQLTELAQATSEWVTENEDLIREWGPLLLKLVIAGKVFGPILQGVGGAVQAFGTLTSVLGKTGLTMGNLITKFPILSKNVAALRGGQLLGSAGLIAGAAAAGFAFGTWLDETFKISDGIAGLNTELSIHNELLGQNISLQVGLSKVRGTALLGTLTDAEQKELKAAQAQKERFGAELAETSAIKDNLGLIGAGGSLISQALPGRSQEEVNKDIQRQQAKIDAINKRGLERERRQRDQSITPKANAAVGGRDRAMAKMNAEELNKVLSEPTVEVVVRTDKSGKLTGIETPGADQAINAGGATEGL